MDRTLPGPARPSIIGHVGALYRDPLGFLSACAERHGDVVDLGVPLRRVVGVFGARAAHDLLVAPPSVVQESAPSSFALPDLRGRGVVNTGGADQRRYRELVMRAFATRHLAGYQAITNDVVRARIDRWPPGAVIDVGDEMKAIARAIAGRLLFDADLERDVDLARALDTIVAIQRSAAASFFASIAPWDVPGVARGGSRRDALAVIRDRARSLRAGSLGSRNELDEAPSIGAVLARQEPGAWTDDELRDNLVQLYLAGNDTASAATTWTLYALMSDRDARARLEREIDDSPKNATDPRSVAGLPFLDAVVKESLRLYPTSPFGVRHVVRAIAIDGTTLAPGTVAIYSPWVTHRMARHFDDPTRFRPERFLDQPPPPRGAYIPFALGPNSCVGAALAQPQIKLVIAAAIRRFALDLEPGPAVGVHCGLLGSLRHTAPSAPIRARLTGRAAGTGAWTRDDPARAIAHGRALIDGVDRAITELLARRVGISRSLVDIKARVGRAAYDPAREAQLLSSVGVQASELGLDPPAVERVFAAILDLARARPSPRDPDRA